jgi:asparaginyl-tRNA synthetase
MDNENKDVIKQEVA